MTFSARFSAIRTAREQLDEQELELIDRARHAGATWAQIAQGLGLGSRQAAEQRRRRLAALRWSRRKRLDLAYSERIAAIRETVLTLQRWIEADRRWDTRFRRAALVRSTSGIALDADPGALYELARHIAADLTRAREQQLPLPARDAASLLRTLLSTGN
ncbi:hypothetical protein [Actinoplanes sp. NPDC020271]|uniref:hypothetical protein n=1 Tax=Actinoplanes sp. NPDC020271 TaxID=3363896 RepID=UPI0037A207B8